MKKEFTILFILLCFTLSSNAALPLFKKAVFPPIDLSCPTYINSFSVSDLGLKDTTKKQSVIVRNDFTTQNSINQEYHIQYTQFKASRFILPAALISYGFIGHYTGVDWVDRKIKDESQRNLDSNTKLDYVTMLMPFAAVYGLDWVGVKPIHNFKDRTITAATSGVIGLGMIYSLKYTTDRWRPDGDDKRSFPSGHTGIAFMGAHMLKKEYGHISPWISVGGYAMATATGLMRITNNKHWFSDVVAGAGFGILSVELGYLLLPYLSDILTFGSKNNTTSLSIAPSASFNQAGLGVQYTF